MSKNLHVGRDDLQNSMSRLRILVLEPDCTPERVSIALVTFSHAAALAQLHDVTLNWAVRRGGKPDLPPPKMLYAGSDKGSLRATP